MIATGHHVAIRPIPFALKCAGLAEYVITDRRVESPQHFSGFRVQVPGGVPKVLISAASFFSLFYLRMVSH